MARRAKPEQAELEAEDGKPIGASRDRDPELHAIGLDLLDLEEQKKTVAGKEKAMRAAAGDKLRARGLRKYDVDGISLWLEGKETVKVKRDSGRPKGKVKKVVAGEDE